MVIKQGRHPVLEQKCDATSNDTYLSEENRFVMMTGPNMYAGKGTFLKQVCLIQILTQMGPWSFICAPNDRSGRPLALSEAV
ncbi:hypothetical protein QR680_017399 [Steinernema hermaphroditum]|uniref:DNA mismatch repair proteins mutS family domain-containing protein n=1 Tax=Steinernema hermaphroditum TaxID=289476 RepID=A0AA39HEF7_9BILA|nr:hypothetical protein QR680_017399 [Steinernema hermaphroditum]